MPDRLEDPEGQEVRGLDCDGFIPEAICDTKYGVEVTRIVVLHANRRCPSRFKVHLPQKLLYKPIRQFDVDITAFEPKQKVLELTVFPKRSESGS